MTDKKELQEIIVDWMRYADFEDDPDYDDFMSAAVLQLGQTMLESGNFGFDLFTEEEIYDIVYNTVTKLLRGK